MAQVFPIQPLPQVAVPEPVDTNPFVDPGIQEIFGMRMARHQMEQQKKQQDAANMASFQEVSGALGGLRGMTEWTRGIQSWENEIIEGFNNTISDSIMDGTFSPQLLQTHTRKVEKKLRENPDYARALVEEQTLSQIMEWQQEGKIDDRLAQRAMGKFHEEGRDSALNYSQFGKGTLKPFDITKLARDLNNRFSYQDITTVDSSGEQIKVREWPEHSTIVGEYLQTIKQNPNLRNTILLDNKDLDDYYKEMNDPNLSQEEREISEELFQRGLVEHADQWVRDNIYNHPSIHMYEHTNGAVGARLFLDHREPRATDGRTSGTRGNNIDSSIYRVIADGESDVLTHISYTALQAYTPDTYTSLMNNRKEKEKNLSELKEKHSGYTFSNGNWYNSEGEIDNRTVRELEHQIRHYERKIDTYKQQEDRIWENVASLNDIDISEFATFEDYIASNEVYVNNAQEVIDDFRLIMEGKGLVEPVLDLHRFPAPAPGYGSKNINEIIELEIKVLDGIIQGNRHFQRVNYENLTIQQATERKEKYEEWLNRFKEREETSEFLQNLRKPIFDPKNRGIIAYLTGRRRIGDGISEAIWRREDRRWGREYLRLGIMGGIPGHPDKSLEDLLEMPDDELIVFLGQNGRNIEGIQAITNIQSQIEDRYAEELKQNAIATPVYLPRHGTDLANNLKAANLHENVSLSQLLRQFRGVEVQSSIGRAYQPHELEKKLGKNSQYNLQGFTLFNGKAYIVYNPVDEDGTMLSEEKNVLIDVSELEVGHEFIKEKFGLKDIKLDGKNIAGESKQHFEEYQQAYSPFIVEAMQEAINYGYSELPDILGGGIFAITKASSAGANMFNLTYTDPVTGEEITTSSPIVKNELPLMILNFSYTSAALKTQKQASTLRALANDNIDISSYQNLYDSLELDITAQDILKYSDQAGDIDVDTREGIEAIRDLKIKENIVFANSPQYNELINQYIQRTGTNKLVLKGSLDESLEIDLSEDRGMVMGLLMTVGNENFAKLMQGNKGQNSVNLVHAVSVLSSGIDQSILGSISNSEQNLISNSNRAGQFTSPKLPTGNHVNYDVDTQGINLNDLKRSLNEEFSEENRNRFKIANSSTIIPYINKEVQPSFEKLMKFFINDNLATEVVVTSATRTVERHNQAGWSASSGHLFGKAVDLRVRDDQFAELKKRFNLVARGTLYEPADNRAAIAWKRFKEANNIADIRFYTSAYPRPHLHIRFK